MSRERTPILTRRQVQELTRYRPAPYLVTTLYLDLDVSTGRGRRGILGRLTREARAALEARDLPRKQRQSAEQDLDAMERIARDARTRSGRSVCAIVSSGPGFGQVIDLPHRVKNRIVQDHAPYVRPLEALLDDYPRYLVVLTDRSRARLAAVHLGRVREVSRLDSEVPGQVKDGLYRGRGNVERQIERHIDDHVLRHIKSVAETVRETFGERDYDWLISGGTTEAATALAEALNPGLKAYLAGQVQVEITASPEGILGACQERIAEINAARDRELLERLTAAVEASGMGVTGLAATLGALRRGAIDTLILTEDLAASGAICPACGFLGAEEGTCPACGDGGPETESTPDIVTEIIDRAAQNGARIRHVATASARERLASVGGIGAILRFRLV